MDSKASSIWILQGGIFESVGERLIIHSVVVDPLISHLEKERKLYPCQTPYLKRNFRRVKYYNLGKLNSKYKY